MLMLYANLSDHLCVRAIDSLKVMVSARTILSCLLLSASTALSASPYIGLGVGAVDYSVDIGTPVNQSYEDTGTGNKIFAGYQLNKYVAGEVSYYNFAEASVGALETSPGSGNFISAEASASGLAFYAVGIYPLSKTFRLSAKAGMLNWNADLTVDKVNGSNDGSDLAYGLSAAWSFTKTFEMRGEWEKFETDNPELSMLSVSFVFVFD